MVTKFLNRKSQRNRESFQRTLIKVFLTTPWKILLFDEGNTYVVSGNIICKLTEQPWPTLQLGGTLTKVAQFYFPLIVMKFWDIKGIAILSLQNYFEKID